MKKKIFAIFGFFLTLFFSLLWPSFAQAASDFIFNPPPSQLSNNLYHYWKLDENTGPGCNTGYFNSGPADSWAGTCGNYGVPTTGKLKGALYFDGGIHPLNLPSSPTAGWSTNWTMSAWVNSAGSQNGMVIFNGSDSNNWDCNNCGGGGGFGFGIFNGNRLIGKFVGPWNNHWAADMDGGYSFTDTNWHFVAMTNDGQYTRFYVDGTLTATQALNGGGVAGAAWYIGAQHYYQWNITPPSGADRYPFYGTLDEVASWYRALSAQEVANLYNAGAGNPYDTLASPTLTNTTINSSTVVPDGITQYTITTTATSTTGSTYSPPLGGYNIGSQYAAINLQGTNAGKYRGYLGWSMQNFPANSVGIIQGPVACAGGGQGAVFDAWGSQFINLVSCSTTINGNSRSASFVVTFSPSFVNPTGSGANTLSGWTETFGGSSYTAGWTAGGTFTLSPPLTCSPPTPLTSWWNLNEATGSAVADAWGTNFGTANSDISNNVLSQTFANTSLNNNLISYWGLDDSATSITAVDSAAGNNGTYNGSTLVPFSPTPPSSKNINARNFNGTNNYIDIANSSTFDLSYYTISAWVYSSNYVQNGFIFEKGPVNTQYSLFFESGYVVQRSYNSTGAAFINQYTSLATAGIANNNWYHLVSTYDGSAIKLYVNGILKSNVSVSGTLRTGQVGQRIGAYGGSAPAYFFNGIIDEVGIWNRTLLSSEITQLYSSGNGDFLHPVRTSSKVAVGAISPYAPSLGPLGNARVFNGTSDYVNIPDNVSLTSNTMTIEAWVKPATFVAGASIYNRRSTSNIFSGTVGYWKLDEPSGQTVADATGSNNGTATGCTFPTQNGASITANLVSFWHMDESSGFTVSDTQNTNNGTATGTTITPGKINNGRSFNGTSDYINVNNVNPFRGQFSIAAWVNFSTVNKGSDNAIMGNGSTAVDNGLHLGERSSKFYFGFYGDDLAGNTVLTTNTWYHVVFVYDGGKKIYVNGVLDAQGTSNAYQSTALNTQIGQYPFATANKMSGVIDEAGVWSRVLTPTEISLLASGNPTTNLVSYWKFDDGSPSQTGVAAADSLGSNNGTANGTTVVGPSSNPPSKIGNARTFNGTSDYIDLGNPGSLQLTGSFTMSAWVWSNGQVSGGGRIISKLSNSPFYGYEMGLLQPGDGRVFVNLGNNGLKQVFSTYAPSLNTWHYITFTYDTTTGTGTVYIDGNTAGNNTSLGSTALGNTSTNLNIGRYPAATGYVFNGAIDEAGIWNRALAAGEVNALYNSSSGQTCTPSPLAITGKISYGRGFNGGNDLVSINSATNLSFEYNQPLTIGTWIKTAAAGNYQFIFDKILNNTIYTGYELRLEPTGKLGFAEVNDGTNSSKYFLAVGTRAVNDGTWHYVTVTYNGNGLSSGVSFYVDGSPDATSATNGTLNSLSILNSGLPTIGVMSRVTPTYFFNGTVDEVGVWNRVLSASEISYLYNSGSGTQYSTSVSGTVGLDLSGTSGQFACNFNVSGTWQQALSPGNLAVGSWNHVACTYNGGDSIYAYLNGTAGTPTPITGTINNPTGSTILIGKNIGGNYFFNGAIDEVRVFNTALSAAQIQAEYQRTAGSLTCGACGGTVSCGVGSQNCTGTDTYCTAISTTQSCVVPGSSTGGIFQGVVMNAPVSPVKVCATDQNTGAGSFGTICTDSPGQPGPPPAPYKYQLNLPGLLPGPTTYNFSINSSSIPPGYSVAPQTSPGSVSCGGPSASPTLWYLSDAGVVAGKPVNTGSGSYSQSGTTVPPGYNLNPYTNYSPITNLSYNYLKSTIFRNVGITEASLTAMLNCQTPGAGSASKANAAPITNQNGQTFDFFCYSGANFDTQLQNALTFGTSTYRVLYPYNTSGTQTITTPITSAQMTNGINIIALVNGSLRVNAPIAIAPANTNASALFIMNNPTGQNGDLLVQSTVGTASPITGPTPPATGGYLDGIYIFPGVFNDNADNASSPNIQLIGLGSLIGTGTGTWSFGRAVPASSNMSAEMWFYQGKYLAIYNNIFSTAKYTWQELPPQ